MYLPSLMASIVTGYVTLVVITGTDILTNYLWLKSLQLEDKAPKVSSRGVRSSVEL